MMMPAAAQLSPYTIMALRGVGKLCCLLLLLFSNLCLFLCRCVVVCNFIHFLTLIEGQRGLYPAACVGGRQAKH